MKPTYGAVSRYGMIAFASSLDQCGPLTRDVTDAALLLQAVEGRDHCDSTSIGIDGGIALPSREDLKGLSFGVPRELAGEAEGIESGVREVFERTVALIEELGGEVAETELPHAQARHLRLLRARSGGGLGEPGALRRRALRATGRGRGPDRDVRGDPGAGIRRGGEAPHHARHLRALLRLLRGLLRPRPAGPHQDRRGLRQSLRALRLRRHPDLADGRLQARRTHRRSRWRCTCRTTAPCRCRWPGSRRSRSPPASAQPDGGGPELPVGFQIAGPAFSDSAMLDAAHALEGAIGFRRDGNGAAG